MTSEWRTGTSPFRHTFVYDTRGNRTLKVEDGARTTLVYDAANQLSSSQDAGGTTNYTYDANGNQHVTVAPGGSRTTQIWDYENRLVKTLQPGAGVFTMAYDADGLRVRKETPSEAKLFVWDDQNYLAETDDSGVTEVAYTTEPSTYGSTISHRSGGATTTYHFDALAAARVLTNTSETVLESYNYTAFGTIQGTPTLLSPFLWGGLVGYYWDADLAAQYIRARHYQPSIARWISLDPIGFAGGDSNLFRYVGNLPTSGWLTDSNVDPSGLQPSTIPPQPKWTCETARKKLQQLYNIWQLLGFTISADLLLRFLNQTKTDSNDLSASICPELDKRLSFTDWVAGNFCLFSKDGSFPIGGGTTDYEFLSGVGLLFDALDGEFDDLHDLGYAIGTAHVRGTDGSCQNIDCCRTKVTGKYKITDRFAFHASPIRQQNDYYDAGVFLQNNNCPKKYRSIGWFVNCTLSKTLDGCNAPPIPPG